MTTQAMIECKSIAGSESGMRMLVIAAHPDDEVLGCGGYIARFAEKNEVFTTIVTEGCSAQYADSDIGHLIEMKKEAAAAANHVLGVKEIFFGAFPDMRLDEVCHIEINRFIYEVIENIRPDLILTHHPGDVNLDHQLVYQSTMVASRPINKNRPDILLYETPSATEWHSYDMLTAFIPNVFIDISGTLDRKIEALKCYDLELRSLPHPRSAYGLRAYAAFRGLSAGLEAAEGFRMLRAVDYRLQS